MANSNKSEVIAIDDDAINKAIDAIGSTEPSPEETLAAQLAKLIPFIRAAINRRESHDKIRRKIRSAIPKLHYKRINALFESAAEPARDQHELANQTDQLQGGAQ